MVSGLSSLVCRSAIAPKYPKGDVIGVLTRWKPVDKVMTWQQAETILNAFEQGDPNGMFFSSSKNSEYWAVLCSCPWQALEKAQHASNRGVVGLRTAHQGHLQASQARQENRKTAGQSSNESRVDPPAFG